jgi:hypothetical protein
MCSRECRSIADELMQNAAPYASLRYQMPLNSSSAFKQGVLHVVVEGAMEMIVGARTSTPSGEACNL